MADDCIFCRVVAGDAPAYVVAEDDATVAFLDRGQATEGHTLVVPRAHSVDPDGLNLTQSNRPAGWQDVFHFHLHVIPRWSGDGLTPPWRPTRPSDEQLAATLAKLL